MRRRALLAFFILASAWKAHGADLPIFDSDNFVDGFRGPSMAQALALTTIYYEESHRAIQKAWGTKERYARWSVALFDTVTSGVVPLPLSDTWLHEEYHRAVMSNQSVSSFNDVYHFEILPDAIAVSHVKDEALTRMKLEHPADFVRLHVAGIEGEYALVERLERRQFFQRSDLDHLVLYWLIKLNTSAYVLSGTDHENEDDTAQWEREEGTDVRRRDFTGHDFTAWAYDLSRPDEPYAARGVHPSGVGIRRYRRPSDLTPAESDYLDMAGRRSLLNFLDPNLAGIPEFQTGSVRWNAAASSLLTSFGLSIDVRGYFERDGRRIAVALHRYSNHDRAFPGIEAELVGARITPRIALWIQPRGQQFRTHDGTAGGLIGASLRQGHLLVELEAKTEGWVESNVHLDRAVSARAGITF